MAKTLVAYDYSGSTRNQKFYHETVQMILKQYEPYDVVLWSHCLTISSQKELEMINKNKAGCGGTEPIVVAEYLDKIQYTGHVVLITDGDISEYSVNRLDEFMKNHILKVSHIDCYLIYTGWKLNATVIAPFLSRFSHSVTLFNDENTPPVLLAKGGTTFKEFINKLQSIKTIEDFEQQYDELFSETISKLLGKANDLSIKGVIADTLAESKENDPFHRRKLYGWKHCGLDNFCSRQFGVLQRRSRCLFQ